MVYTFASSALNGNVSTSELGAELYSSGYTGGIVAPNYTFFDLSTEMIQLARAGNLRKMDVAECIRNYAVAFPTNQGNVILVTENSTSSPTVYVNLAMQPIQDMYAGCPSSPSPWICNQLSRGGGCHYTPCLQRLSELDAQDWRPFGDKIEYCLSQDVPEKCSLALSYPIIIVVIVFNFAKLLLLICTIWICSEQPLITFGDAVSSFLENEDLTTRDAYQIGKCDAEDWDSSSSSNRQSRDQAHKRGQRKWRSAISTGRWVSLLIL